MSRTQQRGLAADARKVRKRAKRPCRSTPAAPTGLTGSFDRKEGGRGHGAWRANLKWNEVTTDTAGRSISIERYRVYLYWSTTSGGPWQLSGRYSVPGKRDQDPNDMAHLVVRVAGRLWYRYEVFAVDRAGCRGASASYDLGNPGANEPPPPTDVQIDDGANDRIVMRWALADDPDDANEIHRSIDHCGAEVSTQPDFSTIIAKDRHFRGERVSFRIPKAYRDSTLYGRVWTVDADGNRSVKIPAWNPDLHAGVGNSDPYAPPDGVRISGPNRQIIVFTIPGNAQAKRYPQRWTADRDYRIRRIRLTCGDHDPATHPDDGTPGGSALKANLVWTSKDLSTSENILPSDERLRVEPNTHKDTAAVGEQDFNRKFIPEDSHLNVRIVSVGSSRPGSDVEIQVVLEEA